MMISRAEQQQILKMSGGAELNEQMHIYIVQTERFKKSDILALVNQNPHLWSDQIKGAFADHYSGGTFSKIMPYSENVDFALLLAKVINEPLRMAQQGNTDWTVTVGRARKEITASHPSLAVAICKVLLIYERKFS